jgi:hypothetical protein
VCSIFFKLEGEVPEDFLGTVGFSLRMDGRYKPYALDSFPDLTNQ